MVLNNGYTHFHGPEVNTRAVVSQKVRLFSYNSSEGGEEGNQFQQMGLMTNFTVSENRNVEAVKSIGFGDRISELVPGITDPATIQATRIALWLSNIFQAFGYKSGIDGIIRSLRQHRWPFDIRQELIFSEIAQEPSLIEDRTGTEGVVGRDDSRSRDSTINENITNLLLTIYEGCWMTSYNTAFNSQNTTVAEDVGISVSDIVAVSNLIGLNTDYLNEESNQDRAFRVRPDGAQ